MIHKKKPTPQEKISLYAANILEEISRWQDIKTNGCNDPFWSDGCNMELVRNHILYYKRKIRDLCEENSFPLPEEYFLPTPPEVDDMYMADIKSEKAKMRLERILVGSRRSVVTKCPSYSDDQMSFI